MIVFSGESVSLPATFITHRILTIDYHEYTNRIINYRDKIDYANTTYAIEIRCISAAPGNIIMYSGFVNVDYVYIDVNN